MPTKADVLKSWYKRVWSEGDLDALSEILAPNARTSGVLPEMELTRTDVAELVPLLHARLGPIAAHVVTCVEAGDWVACLVEVSSHRIDTGDPVQITTQTIARIEHDQIVEAYSNFDFLSLFEQLGQLPPDSLAILLAGNRLV